MHLTLLEWALACVTVIVQLLLLVTMVKRKARSTFPVFFNYVVFFFVNTIFLTTILPRISPSQYFYSYWSITVVGMVFGLWALYEVFVHILKPYDALVDLGKLLYGWVVLFLLLASVLTAVATTGTQIHRICTAIQLCERSIELMQCGFLLLLVLFETRLGLSWRSPAICIMLGIGVLAASDLSGSYITAQSPSWSYALDIISACVSLMIYSAWLASMIIPQPARKSALDSPSRLIFQRWNEALVATPLVGRRNEAFAMSSVESFLPGVERTVERVMARKMMH